MPDINMIDLKEVHSLTNFVRNTRHYTKRLKQTGRPALLTVNGQAEIVMQDVTAYQHLLRKAQEADDLRRLRRSLADVHAGRGYDAEQVLDEMELKHFGEIISRKKKGKQP